MDGVNEQASRIRGRIYNIASDGDSRRRRALADLTMTREVLPGTPLHLHLGNLSLFNLSCGFDDVTVDIDYKHIIKRARGALIRSIGSTVDGVVLSTSITKLHLVDTGLSSSTVHALFNPDDRQDVVLALRLLSAVQRLPLPSSCPERGPAYINSRRVLRLHGKLWHHLLEPYTNVNLSLQEQLIHLSTAAHTALQVYHTDGTLFIPSQLMCDLMLAIKNVYFSVAKFKIDNPAGQFYIILLGTDRLESVFGSVRTMVGNNTNPDGLQLSSRLSAATVCTQILQQHPEWAPSTRRMKIPTLQSQGDDISKKSDHVNPASWVGNVNVANVTLQTRAQQDLIFMHPD